MRVLIVGCGYIGIPLDDHDLRYEDAEQTLERGVASFPDLTTLLGEVRVLRGERAEAEELFVRAVREGHRDALMAQVHLARLWLERPLLG